MQLLYILESIRTPFLDAVLGAVTHLGGETVFMALGVVIFWCVDKYCGYYMLGMGFAGTVLNQFLKLAFRIPRPWVLDPEFTIVESAREAATGYSFPSGHTQNALAALGAPAVWTKRVALRIVLIVLALLTAFSRMYLGVHTPLDVLVSLGTGILLLAVLAPAFLHAERRPLGGYIVLGLTTALALAYVLWTELYPFPADVDADNLASGIKNAYTLLGAGAGLFVVYHLDTKYIKFRTGAFAWAQVMKVVPGLAIVLLIRLCLKSPLLALFGGHNAAHAVRYFIMVIFAGAVWPLTFPWFARRCKTGADAKRLLRNVLIVLVVLLLLAGGLFFAVTRRTTAPAIESSGCANPLITPLGETMLSAHRAGGGEAPENTMLAFQNCVENTEADIDIFEMDLHLTADNELILLHDSTMDRTSDAVSYFGETDILPSTKTLAELKNLNMGESFEAEDGSFPYAGLRGDAVPDELRVTTLSEVLEYLESRGEYRYIIEIKDSQELGYRAADELYSVLSGHGCLSRAVIGTFNTEVTAYMDGTYPDMPRSAGVTEALKFYIYSFLGLPSSDADWAFVALQIPVDDYVLNLGTTRLVNYAHKCNIAVQYWTINDLETMSYLQDIGADAIMTDLPELAAQALK